MFCQLLNEEEALADKHNLDDEQLQFRRRKIAQNGPDLWNQEYPDTPETAFSPLTPCFRQEQLQRSLENARDVSEAGTRGRRVG